MTKPLSDRILVVDDSRPIHDDFAKILQGKAEDANVAAAEAAFFGTEVDAGSSIPRYELDHAFQGEEALQLVSQAIAGNRPYSFAFIDMRMPPGWDGIETIQRLWGVDPKLHVVVCTAYSDYSWSEMIDQLGVNDQVLLLKKPFDPAEVQQIAVTLTEKRRLADTIAEQVASLEITIEERTAHLRSAHTELDELLRAISSILIGIDLSGAVCRWNQAAENILEVATEDAIGEMFLELPINWNSFDDIEKIANSVDCSSRMEATFQDASGRNRILGFSAYPVGAPGEPKGMLLLGAELTAHKVVEHQLQQAQKLEAVGQLAAGVAHEINTPMQYLGDNLDFLHNKIGKLAPLIESYEEILGLAQQSGHNEKLVGEMNEHRKTLKIKSFVAQALEAITDSQDGVKHVSRIVRAMKEFSHPGQDEKTSLDINNALESAAAVSTNEWKYVAEVEFDLDDALPIVTAFPGEVNQVFLNIIVNAAHAIGECNDDGASGKGSIRISTKSTDTHVVVTIQDNGTGISDENRGRIFDPFFTTKEVGKGTGQGLSIAHSVIVQKHGGMLTCDSTPGEGTTFKIQLPIDGEVLSDAPELETCEF